MNVWRFTLVSQDFRLYVCVCVRYIVCVFFSFVIAVKSTIRMCLVLYLIIVMSHTPPPDILWIQCLAIPNTVCEFGSHIQYINKTFLWVLEPLIEDLERI